MEGFSTYFRRNKNNYYSLNISKLSKDSESRMDYISDFSQFCPPEREIYAFLTHNLFLGWDIDTEIKEVIDQSDQYKIIDTLLSKCVDFCYPYLYHPTLSRLNIINLQYPGKLAFGTYERLMTQNSRSISTSEFSISKDLDPNLSYLRQLKNHVAISFYYSWKILTSKPLKLCEAIKLNLPKDDPDSDYIFHTSSYASLKYRQRRTLIDTINSYAQLYPFFKSSMKDQYLYFNIADSAVILGLLGHQQYIPYDNTYRSEPYNYDSFQKLILNFVIAKSSCIGDKPNFDDLTPCSKEVIISYTIERLLHYDLISFLIAQHASSANEDIDFKKFMILGELAALPNVFSRIDMVKTILDTLDKNLRNAVSDDQREREFYSWTESTRTLIKFLTKCTFPILNLAFKYIMEYYVFCCLNKGISKDTIDHIDDIFEEYFNDAMCKQELSDIYYEIKRPPYVPDSYKRSHIAVSKNSYQKETQSPVKDTYGLCVPLSKLIFFDKVMTQSTFDANEINYTYPFMQNKIEEMQLDRINYLMYNTPIIEYDKPFRSSDIITTYEKGPAKSKLSRTTLPDT
ncbi:MAG: hypothetical protein ABFC57_09525 [Veillonellales bacterium]